MGLKGFPESAKFRHLFVPGLFQLPRSVTVKAISLSLRRKGGERGKWFKTGQVTVRKKKIILGGGQQHCLYNLLLGFIQIFGDVVNLSSRSGFCVFGMIIWV